MIFGKVGPLRSPWEDTDSTHCEFKTMRNSSVAAVET